MDTFLPALPLQMSYPLLFGVLLVAGMMGGELARLVKLPRIIGYTVVGLVMGPLSRAMGMEPLIDEARIFLDLALGLVLFELGRRMDLKWMRRDWTLAAMGFAESAFSFAAVFITLRMFDFEPILAGLAASIAMTASPAVLLFIVHDTRSEGQVTSRAFNLVAMNGLLASTVATLMLGSVHLQSQVSIEMAILHPLYLFLGSLVLGALMATLSRLVARTVQRSPDVHFTLIAGMVVGAVGLAVLLRLPVILALLSFGLFARNDERGHDLLNVSLAPFGRLLFIVLFVITGASLSVPVLAEAGLVAIAFVAARAGGKFLGVLAFARLGELRMRQAVGLGLVLTPMSTLALLMAHDIAKMFAEFRFDMLPVFLAAILIMELTGPMLTQFGLRVAGETLEDPEGTMGPRSRLR
jgi:Kef-type K+ transport system membrane component KefB